MKSLGLINQSSTWIGSILIAAVTLMSANAFDLPDLQSIVDNGNDTPEKIIAALPATLRSNANFIFESHSLQFASVSRPRVLLWDAQTGFSLSYNGDPSLKGYKTLEMMSMNHETGKISFYEMNFPQKGFKLSQPATCVACHGPYPRPIWGAFPTWPGAYGQVSDLIQGDEVEGFRSFQQVPAQDPRYQSIQLPKLAAELNTGNPVALADQPNTRFGALLSRMNALRVQKILDGTDSGRHPQILALFAGCASDEESQAEALQLLNSLGLTFADLDLRYVYYHPNNDNLDFLTSYVDGASNTREQIAYRLFKEWLPTFSVDQYSLSIAQVRHELGQDQDPRDAQVMQDLDSWGGFLPLNMDSVRAALCQSLRQNIVF